MGNWEYKIFYQTFTYKMNNIGQWTHGIMKCNVALLAYSVLMVINQKCKYK
jgi:hypothetical protein